MTKEDKILHQALIKLLNEGTFQLKAREVPPFLRVYNWVQAMPENWKQPEPVAPKPTRKKKATK